METTTVRIYKQTQKKLKKISVHENVSIVELLDKLIKEHEKSFWHGFDDETKFFLDKEEIKARKTFEKVLKDGLSK